MEAKELRIGNYVNLIADGHEHEPDTFQWTIEDYEYYETEMFNILPIPLTKEWLVKFGFDKLEGWDDMFYFQIGGFQIYESNVSGYEYDGFNIKYLHQLQNLYFALTNEELTIKQ